MNEPSPDMIATLKSVADNPVAYAQQWKDRTGGRVIGSFPMNFPSELVHAAGALPVIVQESRTPITEGRSLLAEFYCGYTRSVADQVALGELDVFDAFVAADHCVQLLGAVDVIRWVASRKAGALRAVHHRRWTTRWTKPGPKARHRRTEGPRSRASAVSSGRKIARRPAARKHQDLQPRTAA